MAIAWSDSVTITRAWQKQFARFRSDMFLKVFFVFLKLFTDFQSLVNELQEEEQNIGRNVFFLKRYQNTVEELKAIYRRETFKL